MSPHGTGDASRRRKMHGKIYGEAATRQPRGCWTKAADSQSKHASDLLLLLLASKKMPRARRLISKASSLAKKINPFSRKRFKSRPHLKMTEEVDSVVDKIFEEFDKAVELYDRGIPGPYKLAGEYTLAAFERFRYLSQDNWRFCYVQDKKLILSFGDCSIPHNACTAFLSGEFTHQMRGWLRQAPPTGIDVIDACRSSSDFNPALLFRNVCGILQGMYDDSSRPFLNLRRPGQGRGTLVRKELDIDIAVTRSSPPKLIADPLVMGEIAYRNEDLDHLISELWLLRGVARHVIGVKISVS
jgi:hypothetical protein